MANILASRLRWLPRWLIAPPEDLPGQLPRRRLLYILLLGAGALCFLMALVLVPFVIMETATNVALFSAVLFVAIVAVGLLWINYRVRSTLAAWLFLLITLTAILGSDEPRQMLDGRSTLLVAFPILVASFTIQSKVSFGVAGISAIGLLLGGIIIGPSVGLPIPNFPGMITYFVFALVAWLAADNLERLVRDLWKFSQDLELQVSDRTRELYEALTREHAEVAKNQAIITSIADGVIVFNPDGKARVVNPALPLLLGLTSDQILDRSFEELAREGIPEEQRPAALQALQNASSAGPSDALPFSRFQWHDKTLLVSFAPVRNPDTGEIPGTVAVFHDFTREAELEAMKSRFVSMVSHELRTPLNAIIGYADMLLEAVYEPLNDGQKGVVQRILSNTNRQLNIVNDLLDRAQMEAGRLILRSEPFSPAALLDDLYGMMNTIAQAKDLRLIIRLEPDMPATLYGDHQRLHQILVNLANNAIKFTDRGIIGVRLYRPDAAHWAMDVVDTGKGIEPEAQKFIFDPFRQVDGTATRSHKGVGLGLSIVRDLVSLMKGEIKVTSTLGKGSTFTIVLPLEPAPVKESTA